MSSIVIGVDRSGAVADHASSVVALVEIDSEGNTTTISFESKSNNPGHGRTS